MAGKSSISMEVIARNIIELDGGFSGKPCLIAGGYSRSLVSFSVFIDHEVADSSFICPDSDHTASNCLRCPAHHAPAMGPCKEEFGWTYMQGRFDTVYKWEYLRTEIEAPMILGSFLSNMSVQKKNSLNSSHFELSICHDGYCILIKLYSSSGIRSFCKKIIWISISQFFIKSTLVGFPSA